MPVQAKSDWTLKIAAAAVLLLLAPRLTAQPESGPTLGGTWDLIDHDGQPWSLVTTRDKVVILSFGYTSCPDVCPMTLGIVSSVLRDLGPHLDEVRALFISLDPERDSPEKLREYVRHFHPAIVGLTGSQAQLRQVRQAFKVTAIRRPSAQPQDYTLDHTANIYLLDAAGRVARIVPFGLPPELLKSQTLELLATVGNGPSDYRP